MTYELPAAPLSIGGVLDSAIRLYRDSLRRTIVVTALYSATMLAFGLLLAVPLSSASALASKDPRKVLALMTSPVMLGALTITILVAVVFYGALMKTLSAWAAGNRALSLKEAIATGIRRFPAVLLGGIINSLALVIGFLLLVIPGVYAFGKLPLWIAAVFVDDVTAMEGLRRSWRMTHGRWWRGAAIITVAVIMIYVFALAFGLVGGAIGAFAHLGLFGAQVVNQLFSAVANLVVLPMFGAILVVMYHDFKLRDEGGDLAARMGALDQA